MKTFRAELFFILAIVALVAFIKFDHDNPSPKAVAEREKVERREWRETKEGVEYFTTCAEGMLFIVTRSTHHYLQMAGPIQSCTKNKNQ